MGRIPPASRNHLLPSADATPTATAACSLVTPLAISTQKMPQPARLPPGLHNPRWAVWPARAPAGSGRPAGSGAEQAPDIGRLARRLRLTTRVAPDRRYRQASPVLEARKLSPPRQACAMPIGCERGAVDRTDDGPLTGPCEPASPCRRGGMRFSSAATHRTCDHGPFGLPHRSGATAGTERRLGGAARPRR